MHALTARGRPSRGRRAAIGGLIGVVTALAVFAFASPAWAATNLITNGDFSAPDVSGYPNHYGTFCAAGVTDSNCDPASPSLGAWTVTSASVDLYGNAQEAPQAGDPATTQSVDLDGNAPGAISQAFTAPAGYVQLTFAVNQNLAFGSVCGPAVKTVNYGIGNTNNTFTYDPATDSGWLTQTLVVGPFATPTPTTVEFASATAGDCGPVITDVSVVAIPNAGTPLAEPAIAAGSLAVLGALALGYVFIRRRRATPAV